MTAEELQPDIDLTALAEDLVLGRATAVPDAVAADPAAGSTLVDAVVRQLDLSFPESARWPRDEHGRPTAALEEMDAYVAWPGVRTVAALRGIRVEHLAATFLDAIVNCPGPPTSAEMDAVRWLTDHAPERLRACLSADLGIDDIPRLRGLAALAKTLFALPGQAGAEWFPLLSQRWSGFAHHFTQMNVGRLDDRPDGWRWEDEDWAQRFTALAKARLDPRPDFLEVLRTNSPAETAPPPSSAAAQVRLGCVYGRSATDLLLWGITKNLGDYLTGDPIRDVALYWWQPRDEREAHRLRDILEISAPAGYRQRLVAEAQRAGLIDRTLVTLLGDPEQERPEWADGETRWTLSELTCAGMLRLPGGLLGIVDADDDSDPIACAVTGPVHDRAEVFVVTATHPRVGEPWNAAIDVRFADAPVAWWEVLPPGRDDEGGGLDPYYDRIGVGAPEAFEALTHDGDRLQDVYLGQPMLMDYDLAGSVLVLAACGGPCTNYVGRDDRRQVVRVVVDLGLLEIDPTVQPTLPW